MIHLLEKGRAYVPMYMKSQMFNPNEYTSYYHRHDHDICGLLDNPQMLLNNQLTLFFQQPKSWPILKRMEREFAFRKYFAVNPVAKKRKEQRLCLMRFWLLTTKPLFSSWRESLYAPGTGALYKKAAASFESDK